MNLSISEKIFNKKAPGKLLMVSSARVMEANLRYKGNVLKAFSSLLAVAR